MVRISSVFEKDKGRFFENRLIFRWTTMIKLVAFFGNYGKEYEGTRHNVAWTFANQLPFYTKLNFQQKFKGDYACVGTDTLAQWFCDSKMLTTKDGGVPRVPEEAPSQIFFLKPLTYMNLSGESVGELARFYKINPEEILVVHDELELPLGTMSLKWSGGLGGHNGLRSMKAAFGTADFWRLRFGLTKPADRDIAGYVLSKFTQEENEILGQVFSQANELFARILLATDPSRLIPSWGKKKIV